MKNNKILGVVLTVIVLGLIGYLFYSQGNKEVPIDQNIPSAQSLLYTNSQFGFTFALPDSWKGFSVVETAWQGNPLTTTTVKQTGPKLLIRNPSWSAALPYEDIPVLVFTVEQWESYMAEAYAISAAPIQATELGRNNLYVFALPPRWNFDYSEGDKEAEAIVASHPLKAFTIQSSSAGKLNINVICDGALAYMTFSDGASAAKFVSECKEGKHPEVIEQYKAQMNISNDAVI